MKKITNYPNVCTSKLLMFSFSIVLCMLGLQMQAQNAIFNSGTGPFIPPAGITTVQVEVWGAGGAGASSASNSDGGGGGGGGGYSKTASLNISAMGASIPIQVGVGGTGGTGTGPAGTDSWFFNATTVMAKGGTGGATTGNSGNNGGTGGAGGLSTAGIGVTTKTSGGTGGRGENGNTANGGPGGSSGGTSANGTSGAATWSTVTSGAAPTGGGKGGNGGSSGNAGLAGVAPGGGGGGAGDGNGELGGNGAAGRVAITYTCPSYSLTSATTATGPFCAASTSVVTLTSSSMPNGSYTVTYNLSGGTSATGSTAAMTFASGTGTFTTSTLSSSATPTTITITSISSGTVGNGACVSTISTFNTVSVTAFAVTANAGTAFTKTCTANTSGLAIGEASAAGYTYSWSPATGLSATNVSNPTANPASTQVYTVTKTYTATGCSATANVTVTVNNTPPTAVAGADFTKTCTLNPTGKVIGETAVAGNTYSWSPTLGLSSATVANPTANPTITTTYTVTKTTTATGCTAQASITVTVDVSTTTVNAGADFTKTCVANTSGAQIGEAAVAGFTYSWSPATGLSATNVSNPIANPTSSQTYTVTKTNTANGCTGTDTVIVTVNNATVTANAGTDFSKTCATNATGRAIGESSAAGFTYSWSPTLGLSSATVANPTANPTVTTTYTVTKTNTSSGCSSTDDVVVTVNLTTPTADAGADFTKTCATNPTGKVIGEAAESGHTYSWSPTTALSSSTAANPTANPTTTTTYTVTKRNTASGCTDTDTVTVTVDIATPTVAALTGTQALCAGSSTVFSSTTGGGSWGTSNSAIATVSGGTVTGVAAGTTNINYTVTGANGCTTTVSRAVTVNALPTFVVASGAAAICPGTSTNLTGSGAITGTVVTQDDFNGTVTYTSAGSVTSGTTGHIFTAQNSPFNFGITGTVTNNVDGSKFMVATAYSTGNATTTSTMTSPVLNTTGYTTLSYAYNHSYKLGDVSSSAVVQVATVASPGASDWVTVKTYTTAQGTTTSLVADNINLNAYINQPNLRIRFNVGLSVSAASSYWAIENAKFTGTMAPQYSWIADTATGVNGLPAGAGTPSTTNAAITVSPTANTNYTLVVTNPGTGCTQEATPIAVTIKPIPTTTAPGDEVYCAGVATSAITLLGTPSGVTFDISGGAAIGLANATGITAIPSFNPVAGSATISITPKANGCTGTTVTYGVTVHATPAVVAPATQNYCNGVAVSAMALLGSPSGVTFDISGGSAIGLANVTGVTAIPAFTPVTGSATITITPHANGCTGSSQTFTINVNPVLTPVFSPVASICAGTTLTALPTTSLNGVTGNWTPALNNMETTVYTFHADSGQCVAPTVVTLTIIVNTNTTYYFDNDGDGYGNATISAETCLGQPENYVTNGTDCNDDNNTLYRNGLFYVDNDQDGYNNGTPAQVVCYGAAIPAGYVAENIGTDCNDFNAAANPWHEEVLGNSTDDNCDGQADEVGPTSYIIPSQCGATLQAVTNIIYAYQLSQATGYRFEVVNGASVRVYDATVSRFSLLDLAGGVTYNTPYTIRVSLRVGGFWQAYGNPCVVTTPASPPTTSVVPAQCGSTLSSLATTIYCGQVSAANHYRFEVSDGVSPARTYESSLNRFSFTNLSGTSVYNRTYTVRVALRYGSTWQDYGNPCSITTPLTPGNSRIIPSQCGTTISSFWASIYAQQVSEAEGYRFEVTNGASVRYFDSPVSRFCLRNLNGGALPNTTYTVRVAILYQNIYQDFGPACTIITSPSASKQQIGAEETAFEVKTYPNPYAETFKIDINTSSESKVEFRVYDMLGRQIEASQTDVNELSTKELGAQYPSGVYNIIVTQGENIRTLRVIKR